MTARDRIEHEAIVAALEQVLTEIDADTELAEAGDEEPISADWLKSVGIYPSDEGRTKTGPTEFGVRVVGGSDFGWKEDSSQDGSDAEIAQLVVVPKPTGDKADVYLETYDKSSLNTLEMIYLGVRKTRGEILDLCRGLKAWGISYPQTQSHGKSLNLPAYKVRKQMEMLLEKCSYFARGSSGWRLTAAGVDHFAKETCHAAIVDRRRFIGADIRTSQVELTERRMVDVEGIAHAE